MATSLVSIIDGRVFLPGGSPVSYLLSYGMNKYLQYVRLAKFETWKHKMNEDFSVFLPGDLHFENKTEKMEVANRIKRF